MKLTLKEITKRYGDFTANDRITLGVQPGQVHCLLGENGAGKTTLMNVLYGLSKPDGGCIEIDGQVVSFSSPGDAINAGVGMVHQHFMLIPAFTVLENIILGHEETRFGDRLDRAIARERIAELCREFGLNVDPDALVEDLPVGVQQKVEIVKVLYRSADILIFDEPTAVLTPQEVTEFFRIINRLRNAGKAILFITHKLNEVMEISDEITILRHGKIVGQAEPNLTSTDELATMMVGRNVSMSVSRSAAKPGAPILSLENVTMLTPTGDLVLRDVSFTLHAGEILGIAGVHGNGQSELAACIAGVETVSSGRIVMEGRDVKGHGPRKRHKAGLAHIPEDRTEEGLAVEMSVVENSVLDCYYQPRFSGKFQIQWGKVKTNVMALVREFDVRLPSVFAPARALSGGNQQKLVIAREMSRPIRILVAAQPTRGVDVGSIEYIHRRIVEARDEGIGVLLISTELDEVMALSDRILVMSEGNVTAEFKGESGDRAAIGLAMAGIGSQAKEAKL